MTKFYCAVGLLILLFCGILLHTIRIHHMISSLTDDVEQVFSYAEAGDFDTADTLARDTYRRWENAEPYTHIFIRHTDIDTVTDGFCELLGSLAERNIGDCVGSCCQLAARLHGIEDMERITIGSVF